MEAEDAGLTWMGGVSHVVLVRHEVGKLDEDTEEETAAVLLPLFEYRPLYLSIPESGIMVFIVPGTALDLELLRSETGQMKTAPAVEASELCESIRDIAPVYLKMLTVTSAVDSQLNEMHIAVINAISFGEAERLQLAMNALIADMTEDMSVGRLICCDVLHRILRMLEITGLPLTAEKIRMILLPMAFTAPDRQAICAVLTEAKELIRQEETGKANVAADELTERILQYLSDTYSDGSLSVAAVADHFGISISNLSHYFKNHTGLSVSEAIEKLRIEAACRLLLEDKQSVSLISAKVGYTQPATFMRAFKKKLGVTPTEYRVQNGVN